MKVTIEFTENDVSRAIDAGLKVVDLYEVANEDVISRDTLHKFMRAALARLAARK
jgi:hypothetical protein